MSVFRTGLYRQEGYPTSLMFVYENKGRTRYLAKWVTDWPGSPTYTYAGWAPAFTRPDLRLSEAEHAEWGRTVGWCGYCGLKLRDPVSIAHGYGPTCARNHGLRYES